MENTLVDMTSDPPILRLCDFGVARRVGPSRTPPASVDSPARQSCHGHFHGKTRFAAPAALSKPPRRGILCCAVLLRFSSQGAPDTRPAPAASFRNSTPHTANRRKVDKDKAGRPEFNRMHTFAGTPGSLSPQVRAGHRSSSTEPAQRLGPGCRCLSPLTGRDDALPQMMEMGIKQSAKSSQHRASVQTNSGRGSAVFNPNGAPGKRPSSSGVPGRNSSNSVGKSLADTTDYNGAKADVWSSGVLLCILFLKEARPPRSGCCRNLS